MLMLVSVSLSGSIPVTITLARIPHITYAAGPHQVTLMTDQAVRFGYQTDNQFRAERRHANGTVEGYFGFISPDGKSVRTRYTSTGDQGFASSSQNIPETFAEQSEEELETSSATEAAVADDWSGLIIDYDSFDKLFDLQPVVSEEKESISVDSIDTITFGVI